MKDTKQKTIKGINTVYIIDREKRNKRFKVIKKKDLERDLILNIELRGMQLNTAIKISLYKIQGKLNKLISEKETLMKVENGGYINTIDKSYLEKGKYRYEIKEIGTDNTITYKFRVGTPVTKLIVPLIIIFTLIVISQLTLADIKFPNQIKDLFIKEASNDDIINDGEILKDKEKAEESQKKFICSFKIPASITLNEQGTGNINLVNPATSRINLKTIGDDSRTEIPDNIFKILGIKYIINNVTNEDNIIFQIAFNENYVANNFKIILYDKLDEEIYSSEINDLSGGMINIIPKYKLKEKPAMARIYFYNDDLQKYEVYIPIEIQEEIENIFSLQCTLIDNTGKELYVSPLLLPNKNITEITLDKAPDIGEYSISAHLTYVNNEGKYIAENTVSINLVVK